MDLTIFANWSKIEFCYRSFRFPETTKLVNEDTWMIKTMLFNNEKDVSPRPCLMNMFDCYDYDYNDIDENEDNVFARPCSTLLPPLKSVEASCSGELR